MYLAKLRNQPAHYFDPKLIIGVRDEPIVFFFLLKLQKTGG
ncbi:hypothetical protein [Candidatus Methylacidiphilum fumarolicum]|nr:hypothetical protein [Candidatus Methylacidiphilum fumarolicum]